MDPYYITLYLIVSKDLTKVYVMLAWCIVTILTNALVIPNEYVLLDVRADYDLFKRVSISVRACLYDIVEVIMYTSEMSMLAIIGTPTKSLCMIDVTHGCVILSLLMCFFSLHMTVGK